MITELKEKMQKAASNYLYENGLEINYEEDNYAAGIYDGFEAGANAMYAELAPLVKMAAHNFEDIAKLSEKLTTGNVSHNGNTILGKARRNAEYLKKCSGI
jgi:hypothetical protein